MINTRLSLYGALALMILGGTILFGDTQLGDALELEAPIPITKVVSAPDSYMGKLIQVKGKVSAVCEMAGCWMTLVDTKSGDSIRIKVNDGEIVFPPEAVGQVAVAEGKLEKLEFAKEEAIARQKHEAEENGKPFDPQSVKGPITLYQLRGTGAVVLD